MRVFALALTFIAGVMFAAAAPAQQARDWRTTVVQSPAGAFVIGNPAAKVKLVEYLSFTCPHCAHFVAESKAPLHDDLIRRGQVRVEFRHAIRDPLDLSAALMARCAGPRGFAGASQAIFAAQADWYAKGAAWWQGNASKFEGQPEIVGLKALANASGLAQVTGLTPARINQCFATSGDLTKLTAMTKASWAAIKGTPSFTINGKPGGGSDWSALAPELRAAGAR